MIDLFSFLCYDEARRQIGFYGWFPPQRRTEAEVMQMSNVEFLNVLLAIAGLIVGVISLTLAIIKR